MCLDFPDIRLRFDVSAPLFTCYFILLFSFERISSHTDLITFLFSNSLWRGLCRWSFRGCGGQSLEGKTADDAHRLIFVSMTNLLLISSLVSLMSMSLEGVCRYYPVGTTEICS